MSSQLAELRDALFDYSQRTRACIETLEGLQVRYRQAEEEILDLIGGSATGRDREVSDAVQEAGRRLQQSQESLQHSSDLCDEYAEEL